MGCGWSKHVGIDRAVNHRYLLLDLHSQRTPHAAVDPRRLPKVLDLKVVEVLDDFLAHLPAEHSSPLRVHAELIVLYGAAELGIEQDAFGRPAQHTRIVNRADDVFVVKAPEMNR